MELFQLNKIEKTKKTIVKVVFLCYHIKALVISDHTVKNGALEKRLTHMPFTHAFTGSNPVRVTNMKIR